jgi:succinyl-CoA synthetase beta subunit
MATMDIIKHYGGNPANFLDVGGSAEDEQMIEAIKLLNNDPEVDAIFINIFGGIVRCDRVAQGIVDAYKNIGQIPVPIIVRLQGTNAEIAKELIDNSGMPILSAVQFQEAADQVKVALS